MKSFIKRNIKFIILIIICISSSILSAFATTYLFNSSDIQYDNTTSHIQSDNVADAIDELYACASNYAAYNTRLTAVEDYKNQIYPVGSIYISVNNTNPSSLFGGTWVSFGSGRTLVGVNTSDASFDTIEETGGAKSVSYTPAGTNSGGAVGNHALTVNEIPSHNHTYDKSATTTGGTAITVDQMPSHNHTYDKSATATGSTTINFSNGHAMFSDCGSGCIAFRYENTGTTWAENGRFKSTAQATTNGNHTWGLILYGSQAHTHSITLTSTNSGNKGGGNAHTHSITLTSTNSGNKGGGGNHNHPFTQPTFTGTAATINTMDPYITVYMWKRTA